MTQTLTIVARIEAQDGQSDFVKSELVKLIEPTKSEEGCIQYELHQDNENPNVFVFYEEWRNEELLQAHLATPHIAAYIKAVDGAVTSFVLSRMTKV